MNNGETFSEKKEHAEDDAVAKKIAIRALREKRMVETAKQGAEDFYKNACHIEIKFDERNQSIAKNHEVMSEEEFLRWEDAIYDELRYAEREEKNSGMNSEEIAEAKKYLIAYKNPKDLKKTIEVQAAKYYHERYRVLEEVIKKTEGKKAEEDLKFLHGFWSLVSEHLGFKYMEKEDVDDYGPGEYERQRTRTHNDVIKGLNRMNDMAREYGVRFFTVRNFLSSDKVPIRNQTAAIAANMQNDRYTVEEYYKIAFSREVERYEGKMRRKLGLFGYY